MKKNYYNILSLLFINFLLFSCTDSLYGYKESPGLESELSSEGPEAAAAAKTDAEPAAEVSEPASEDLSKPAESEQASDASLLSPESNESSESAVDLHSEDDEKLTLDQSLETETALESEAEQEPVSVEDTSSLEQPLPSEDASSASEASTQMPEREVVNPLVNFSLSADIHDLQIKVEKNANSYFLSAEEDYESYCWMMGDLLLSNEKAFTLDASAFASDSYPLVLFAQKGEILYSSEVYLTLDNKARTILPAFNKTELSDLTLKIYALSDNEILFAEESLTSEALLDSSLALDEVELSFSPGSYRFELSAKVNGFQLYDSQYKLLEANKNYKIDFSLKAKNFISSNDGVKSSKIDIVNYFMSDLQVADATVTLYKYDDGKFSLYDLKSVKDGNLFFYKGQSAYENKKYVRYTSEVEPGIYWFRCDALTSDGKNASYNMEIVYASAGKTSCKILETEAFYKLYSINYDYCGGFYIGDKSVSQAASFDSVIFPTEEEMFRPGYKFSGWYYEADYKNSAASGLQMGSLKKELTLYAKWLPYNQATAQDVNEKCQHIYIEETEDFIELKITDAGYDELYVVEVYNSAGKLYNVDYSDISLSGGECSVTLSFRCRKNEAYLISVDAFENTVLMDEKEVQKRSFSEKYIFVPAFSH